MPHLSYHPAMSGMWLAVIRNPRLDMLPLPLRRRVQGEAPTPSGVRMLCRHTMVETQLHELSAGADQGCTVLSTAHTKVPSPVQRACVILAASGDSSRWAGHGRKCPACIHLVNPDNGTTPPPCPFTYTSHMRGWKQGDSG